MNVAAIVGPTAAGKSAVAEALAERFDAAVVSVDSMQVYRGMDIGTAKPDAAARARIDYRMLDRCAPDVEMSAAEYRAMARVDITEVIDDGRRVIICGGSGLHFRAIVDPLTFAPSDPVIKETIEQMTVLERRRRLLAADPHAAESVDLDNPRRVVRALEIYDLTGDTPSMRAARPEAAAVRSYEPVIPFEGFGIDPGERLDTRIEDRIRSMIDVGFVEEAGRLWSHLGRTARAAIGYAEMADVASGGDLAAGIEGTISATRGLVKRQRTFFRRDPRIRWIDPGADYGACVDVVSDRLEEAGWNS